MSEIYRLMILIMFESKQFNESLELIQKCKQIENALSSSPTSDRYTFLTKYENEINNILNKEQEIQKAKENSIFKKLIPNTESKIVAYLSIISIVGIGLVYISKTKRSK